MRAQNPHFWVVSIRRSAKTANRSHLKNCIGKAAARLLGIDLDIHSPTANPAQTALPILTPNDIAIKYETLHYVISKKSAR